MKRYEIILAGAWEGATAYAQEHGEGDWVKHEDVVALKRKHDDLYLENEHLKRQIADDALTIHTCSEIIDRVKGECGTYRKLLSECQKERDARQEFLEQIFGKECRDCNCMDGEYAECLLVKDTAKYKSSGRRDDCPFLPFERSHDEKTITSNT